MFLKNKKFIWLVFIGLSLVSVIYLGLNLRTKNQKQKPENPTVSATPQTIQVKKEITVENFEIDPKLKWPEVKDLNTYEASVSSVDMLAAAQKLAEGLNISRKSNTPPVWSDKDYTRYLNIDPENLLLKYQID